ncbi:MAG TPA: hypothetical protein VGK00_04170 [Anaerolineales bacterium]|jgi:hypothetical protein
MNNNQFFIDQPARYRLCLEGKVNSDWTDWLLDVSISFENNQTFLTGTVRDQAALFGLLSYVRDLSVPLRLVEFIRSVQGENQ